MYSVLHIQTNIFRSCYPHTEFIEIQGEIGNIKGPVNKVCNKSNYKPTRMPPPAQHPRAPTSVDGFLVEELHGLVSKGYTARIE